MHHMGLKESKVDNATVALLVVVAGTVLVYYWLPERVGFWVLWLGVPWWVRVPVALAVVAPPVWYVAWCWYCIGQRDMKRLAEWHKPKGAWCLTFLRVVCTRQTWRDVKATKKAAAQRRAVRGTAGELSLYVDAKRGPKQALGLLRQWVREAAPTGTGDAWVDVAMPRAVRKITETATGVEMIVAMCPKAGSAKKVMDWAGGIESQAQAPRGSLTIRQVDGQPPHITMWRFTLRAVGKVEPTTTAGTIDAGFRLGINPWSAADVVARVRQVHGIVCGTTGGGKTWTLRALVEMFARATPTPQVVFLDPPGGAQSIKRIAGVRYITGHDECAAYTAELVQENSDRDDLREELELDELGDEHARMLVVMLDEAPELFDSRDTPKEQKALFNAWARLLRNARKNNIVIYWGTQKATKDTLPTKILASFTLRILHLLPATDAAYMLDKDFVQGHMDPSSLKERSGEACVKLPDVIGWQRVNIAPPAGALASPTKLAPPTGSAVTVHGLSTPTVHGPSTALSDDDGQSDEQAIEGGWAEALSADGETDDDRRLKILAALGEVPRPLGLSALEKRTGVPRTTLRRLVVALVDDGLVLAHEGARGGQAYTLARAEQ